MVKKVSTKQAEINRAIHHTYQKIDMERDPYCEGCGATHSLSRAHIISRARAKMIGRPELIFDMNNIVYLCMGSSDSCHVIWDDKPKEAKKLLCYEKMVAFIKENDKEQYRKRFSHA